MLRWAAAALAVIAIFLAGCPENAASPAGGGSSRVDWRSGADQGAAVLVDTDDLLVHVSCLTYGTGARPYLSLTARTRSDDASARVKFRSADSDAPRFGRHRFAQADFDRSYGAWDLLGATPGRIRGRFVYRPAEGDRVAFDFSGSGGRVDGQCDLRGEVASAPAEDPLRIH